MKYLPGLAFFRYWLHHPWQTVLSVLGVAVGVAAVVAVDLARSSARLSMEATMESLSGHATHRIEAGPDGLPEEIYVRLRLHPPIKAAYAPPTMAPVVEGRLWTRGKTPEEPGRPLRVIGVDPLVDGAMRPWLKTFPELSPAQVEGASGDGQGSMAASLLLKPGGVFMSSETAENLGWEKWKSRAGRELTLQGKAGARSAFLLGILDPKDKMSPSLTRLAMRNLLVCDIATAQELLGVEGRLTRVDIALDPGQSAEERKADLQALEKALPPGVRLIEAGGDLRAAEEMTRAFHLNLTALSLLALLVGAFLIHNTMKFAVMRRRRLMGLLRGLGVTPASLMKLVMGEAAALSMLGSLAGLAGGLWLARDLTPLVAGTLNDLYLPLDIPTVQTDVFALAKGLALGLAAGLLSGLGPALEAVSVPAREALFRFPTRSAQGKRIQRKRLLLAGLALALCGGAALALPGRSLIAGFAGLGLVVLAAACYAPSGVQVMMSLCRPVMTAVLGTAGSLAARSVVRSLERTGLAVAALMTAISVAVAMDIMIGSFRKTVIGWLETSLQADIYVSVAGPEANRPSPPLPPDLAARILSHPGVAGASALSFAEADSRGGPVRLVGLDPDPRSYRSYRIRNGDSAAAWQAFRAGEGVLVSEPLAYRRDLRAGDGVFLSTVRGEQEFRILGVFTDFSSDRGAVLMPGEQYRKFWGKTEVSALALFLAPGWNPATLTESLQSLGAHGEHREGLLIRSHLELREATLQVFDRTFAITGSLRWIALMIAFAGVLGALMALALEKEKEMGVLRALGLTPGQNWVLILAQAGLLGLFSGILAIPLALLQATILIKVINRRSFGWSIETHWSAGDLPQAIILGVVAALAAGLYPAWKMARIPPSLALKEE